MSSLDRIRCRCHRSMAALFVAACMTATSVGAGGVPGAGSAEPTRAASQDGPVTVEATGRGESPKEARKEAIVAALRKVVGEYVEADVEIADDEVVRNEILSFSNAGGVKSEQVGEPRFVEGDLVEVTMRVTVEPKPLVARVKGAAKAGAKLDGAALAAEIAAAKDDYEAKKRVLEKAFADLPDAFMTIRIVDSEGKDTQGIDRKLVKVDRASGQATVTIPIVLGFDKAAWKNNVYPALDQVLTAAADRETRNGVVARRQDHRAFFKTKDSLLRQDVGAVGYEPWPVSKGSNHLQVALMTEDVGRGRQLNFDVFEFESAELFPYLSRVGQNLNEQFPRRTLRVRLLDGDGEVVDGGDFKVGREAWQSHQGEYPSGMWAGPQFKVRGYDGAHTWIQRLQSDSFTSLYPFLAWTGKDRWSSSQGVILLAPMFLRIEFLNQYGVGWAGPEVVLDPAFTLPIQDLELIEKIEVELIKPAGN